MCERERDAVLHLPLTCSCIQATASIKRQALKNQCLGCDASWIASKTEPPKSSYLA